MNLLMALFYHIIYPSNLGWGEEDTEDEENQEFYHSVFFLENGLLIKFCTGQQIIPEMVPLQCGWADVSEVLLSG
jgi:hypothetical protein